MGFWEEVSMELDGTRYVVGVQLVKVGLSSDSVLQKSWVCAALFACWTTEAVEAHYINADVIHGLISAGRSVLANTCVWRRIEK